jgi:hypothetical protein
MIDDDDPFTMPTFETTSNEPVLLRYKLREGQKLTIVMKGELLMTIRAAGQDVKTKAVVKIEARATVIKTDEQGNMTLEIVLTRNAMKLEGMPGVRNIDDDDDSPFGSAAITWKVSPVGRLLEANLEPWFRAVQMMGNKVDEKKGKSLSTKLFNLFFVQLSDKSVKAGDRFSAGSLQEEPVRIAMSHEVHSISGDQSQALLKLSGEQELLPDAFPGVEASITKQELTGWLIYDVKNGVPKKVDVRMRTFIEYTVMGNLGAADSTGRMSLTTTLE